MVHKERFYTSHQVYDANHKLHQVLRHALEIVSQFTRATSLNDKCRRVQMAFPEVNSIHPTMQLLDSIKIDRKTAPYERALELAKFIILNYSPDINRGQQKMIALLFNMNELWEEYVLKMLKKYVRQNIDKGWSVSGQESKTFYGAYRTIRPDIVLRRGEGGKKETFVIDTKWKRPTNKSASIEDLRQMYAYGRFWDSDMLMLLYPGKDHDSGYEGYPNEFDSNRNHQCKIGIVNVLDENSLDLRIGEKLINMLNEK